MVRRSSLKRSKPMRSRAEGPTPEKEERPKAKAATKECAHCRKDFTPTRPMQRVCATLRCARGYAKTVREAKERAEREQFKARKEKLKSITEWEHECKAIVQKIARIRDRNDGCISCHMGPDYRGQWHGSHFRPAGNHSAVELHLWNIHKSCAQCNLHKGGNIAGYRPRLIEKIGLDRVKWLESQNQVTKRTVDYLKRFKKVMGKRLRRMERQLERSRG